MVEKITSLTPEQEAQMDVYVDKWIKIGLDTERLERPKVVELINQLYIVNGFDKPNDIIFFDGPNDLITYFKKNGLKEELSSVTNNTVYGNHDATWLSYYEYYKDVLKIDIKEVEKLEILITLGKNCGWYVPYDTTCFVIEKPTKIVFNENNVLHCEDGPAIEYADGFKIYAWEGVQFPAKWLEQPETLTPEVALTWDNVEERRVAMELIGYDKVIDSLDSRTIDTNPDKQIGTLLEVNMPDFGPQRFLYVECATKRNFAIPVPPEMETAAQANAWTFGLDADGLNLEVRT